MLPDADAYQLQRSGPVAAEHQMAYPACPSGAGAPASPAPAPRRCADCLPDWLLRVRHGWLFVESSQNVTLAMAISGIVGRGSQSWSFLAALAILMSLPVVVIFLLLQRQLLDRWLFGAVGVE